MHNAPASEAFERPPPARLRLPLAETIAADPGSITRLAIDLLHARHLGGAAFASALGRYRQAIEELAQKTPGAIPRQIERSALPDEIKNPTVRIAGLPESRLPFSLLGDWVNESLEAALEQEVPPNGKRSSYLRLISRILDRYVCTFFPSEQIPEFYRATVIRLHAFSGQAGVYEGMVIEHAKPLADAAVLSLPDENTNLLKMNSHKSIPIETGVLLTEPHSSPYKRPGRKATLDYGRRFIRPSVSGGMGLDMRMQNLAPIHGVRLGLPGFDRLLAESNAQIAAGKEELLECLGYVIRSGKPSRRSHPDLQIMEFSPELCDVAADVAIAAQMRGNGVESALEALPPEEATLAALFLSASRPFRDACGRKDRRAQLALALSALAVELRASELQSRFGIQDAGEQAQRDIDAARDMVEEYRSLRGNEEPLLRSLKRMRELSNEIECTNLSDYEIALKVVDERYMKNVPLSTLRPPSDSSLPPVPDGPAMPLPSPLPRDLQEPVEPEAQAAAEALPIEDGGIDIEVDEGPLEDEAGMQSGAQEHEQTEPVPVAPMFEEPQPAAPVPAEALPAPADAPPSAEQAPEEAAALAAEPELPKFDFPFSNMPLDTDLEQLLPPKDNARNVLIRRVARALVFYKASGYVDEAIDTRCLDAVMRLKTNYSAQAALDFAVEIVDAAPAQPTAAPAKATAETACELLGKLNDPSRELVAGALGAQSCDEQALSRFLALPAANRELLIQRFIARRWIDGDFRTDIALFNRARESLYSVCGLEQPTPMEKLAAVMDPANLSDEQRFLAGFLFRTSGPITPRHIEALGVWVSSDPSTGEGWKRLTEYWNNIIVREPDNSFNITSGIWLNTPRADRQKIWHCASADILSAGSLAHKLRFSPGERFSFDEASLVSLIYGKSWDEVWTLGDQSKHNLAMALTQHTYKSGTNTYYPEILALAKMPYAFSVPMPGKTGGANPLHYSAMREMEFNTMMDFLGIPMQTAGGSLALNHGLSRSKGNGSGTKPNEDSWSSARVELPDGSVISLDMVADGMGGHNQGSNGGKTNGQVASGIARNIFETAAIAGWIREPEDVRKIILVADLAIVLEQIRKKAYSAALRDVTKAWEHNGVDVPNMNPAWMGEFKKQVDTLYAENMRNADPMQVNNMGTTMTVAFQRGKNLWFIHCGDSDGKVMRDGAIIYNTVGHSAEYELRLGARAAAREELDLEYAAKGINVAELDEDGKRKFEAEADAMFEQRIEPMKDFFNQNKNVVSAVLGVSPKYVHINNEEQGAAPIVLEDGDVVWVSSDGITVPVCDHEIPIVVYEKCVGDLDAAREMFVSLAESRRTSGPNPTLCECRERTGKNDDRTLTLRYASDGWAPQAGGSGNLEWISRRIRENPAELALSKGFRQILGGCSDPSLSREGLMRVFEAIIEAAESTPPRTSTDAYSLALSSIFLVLSRRPDGDAIMPELIPRIGSWSGLVLKKLRESPDASARKRLMFEFAAATVPQDALESLLQARNADIAQWARDKLGMVPQSGDAEQVIYVSSAAPQSMFNSQTDESGWPLDIWSTRYLDTTVVEVFGSSIVQDTAKSLGVLPRDLEIMAFYAYSDYSLDMAVDPHTGAAGQHLIASISDHLCTGDAGRILVASYLLYCLRETDPSPLEAKRMARELWKTMKAMDVDAPYALLFYNKAYEHKGLML